MRELQGHNANKKLIDHARRLSDIERKAFLEVLKFVAKTPGSGRVLREAHKAGYESWTDGLMYLYENCPSTDSVV